MDPLFPPVRVESDVDERPAGTPTEEIYLRELVRLQLTVSTAGLIAFVGVIGALPLALLTVPALVDVTLGGVPVWLFLLGPPPFVLFLAIGWLYRRRADMLDDEYGDLIRTL